MTQSRLLLRWISTVGAASLTGVASFNPSECSHHLSGCAVSRFPVIKRTHLKVYVCSTGPFALTHLKLSVPSPLPFFIPGTVHTPHPPPLQPPFITPYFPSAHSFPLQTIAFPPPTMVTGVLIGINSPRGGCGGNSGVVAHETTTLTQISPGEGGGGVGWRRFELSNL